MTTISGAVPCSCLRNHRVLAYPNCPIPLSFVLEIANSTLPEMVTNTDLSVEFSPQYLLSSFKAFETTGWLYNGVPYFQRNRYDTLRPWFALNANTNIGEKLKAEINLDIRKDYRSYITFGPSRDTTPTTNLPVELLEGNIAAIDMSGPSFGYLAYGSQNVFASLGRTTLSWGPMRNGLALSDASQYYDNLAAGYSTPLGKGNFSYTFDAISVISMLSPFEWEKQTMASENAPHYWDLNQKRIYDEASKWIFGHRIDIQPVSWLRFGIGELNVVGGKHPYITDLNPFIIFHNTYGEGFSNVMLSADISVSPFNGTRIYGEFAMDDFSGPTEDDARGKPTAQAFGGGIEFAFEFSEGMLLLSGEVYHTDTWIYNRWQPFLKWTNRTYTKSELPGSRDLNDYPIGFKYGPDLNGFSIFADYILDNLKVRISFDRFEQGEIDLNTPYLNMDEPSDEPGEFTGRTDWRGPVGVTTTANMVSASMDFPLKSQYDLRIGSDIKVYFGDYFEKFGYSEPVYELRPYISLEF